MTNPHETHKSVAPAHSSQAKKKGEIGALLEDVAKAIGDAREKVVDAHEKCVQTRAEALPAESGDTIVKKEQEGEIPSQGSIDRLASVKSSLEQLEKVLKQSS